MKNMIQFNFEIIIIGIIILFYSCTPKASISNENISNSDIKNINKINRINEEYELDTLLTCSNYAYFENYFRMADEGCIYNPKYNERNNLGWADIILVSKKNLNIDPENYDEQDSVTNEINLMNSKEIKKSFNAYIFLIDKKYLKYYPEGEITYYPNIPYVIELFESNIDNKSWMLIDSIQVNNEGEDIEWREKKITQIKNN